MHAPLRTKQQQQQQQKSGDSNNIKHFAVQRGFTLVKMGFGVQREWCVWVEGGCSSWHTLTQKWGKLTVELRWKKRRFELAKNSTRKYSALNSFPFFKSCKNIFRLSCGANFQLAFPLFRFPPRASSDNRKAPKLISKVHSALSFYLSRSGLSFHFGRPSLHRLVFLFFFSSSVFQLVERKLNF